MAGSYPNQANPGLFVPTTNVWDVAELYTVDVQSSEFRELLVRLYQNINTIALALNLKDSAYYVDQEFVNGQVLFPNPALSSSTASAPVYRQVFRKVIDFGALANAGTKSVAHGLTITAGFSFTRIYATASDTIGFNYIPIPYASVAAGNVELNVDLTNVTIITGSDYSAFTICYVILEYVKS